MLPQEVPRTPSSRDFAFVKNTDNAPPTSAGGTLPPRGTRQASASQVGPKAGIRALGYIRVSTEKQAAKGISLDAQWIRLHAHCIAVDIDLVGILADEGQSAKSLDRPGLKRALAWLTAGQADVLVVVKLDRLTRNMRDFAYLVDTYFADWRT